MADYVRMFEQVKSHSHTWWRSFEAWLDSTAQSRTRGLRYSSLLITWQRGGRFKKGRWDLYGIKSRLCESRRHLVHTLIFSSGQVEHVQSILQWVSLMSRGYYLCLRDP
jgi:hypothetical protein